MESIKERTSGVMLRVSNEEAKALTKLKNWTYIPKSAHKAKVKKVAKINRNIAKLNYIPINQSVETREKYVHALFNNGHSVLLRVGV